MKRILIALFGLGVLAALMQPFLPRRSGSSTPTPRLVQAREPKGPSSVDHARFAQLQKAFSKPQEVTAACLSCHNGTAAEVMKSSHWNWTRTEYIAGKGIRAIGKKNALNNFCIGVEGNEQSCTKCHAGYGYSGKAFDFSNPLNIDCLACHDTRDAYVRTGGPSGGMPAPQVDLAEVAQHVGRPTRVDCLTCHGFGGGGNNVKHGDLEKALFEPSREVDVHMATDGRNLQCVDCHTTRQHQILGKMYSISSMNRDRVSCASCHTDMPHADDVLNQHTLKVACQTCHIPTYAKVAPTKLRWDWSTAGRLKDGKPFEEKGPDGMDTYLSIKGSFTWGQNLQPEYAWFNGTASHYLLGEPVGSDRPVKINTLLGSYADPNARIIPVKIHRAVQPYDPVTGMLIQPKTVSMTPGDGGYWVEFDWQKAHAAGMKEAGLPYSGQYQWIETEMAWPINHMVSPKAQAVSCTECHTRINGRLAKLTGFYLPGRDSEPWVERLGKGLLMLTLAGVLLHGVARMIASRRRKEA